LNRIPHPWTLLGSDLVYTGLDSSSLGLKVLTALCTQTPLQFRPAFSIFFLSLPGQLTQVTFTLSAYLNLARTTYPILTRASYLSLIRSHQCLPVLVISLPKSCPNTLSEPYPITSMFTQTDMFIPSRITVPDSSPDRTSTYPTLHGLTRPNYLTRSFPGRTSTYRSYPATLPAFLTRPGNTLLHPTAYLALPNQLIRPGTLQLTSLENFLIGLPP
jgi:hypothetical protein